VSKLADEKKWKFNETQMKLAAAISMLIDHAGLNLFRGTDVYIAMRAVGRMAFPIFAFFLVESYFHTRSWKKYALRLGLSALVSEIPFDLMKFSWPVDWRAQNVLFTLFLGLLTLKALDMTKLFFARCRNILWNADIQLLEIAVFSMLAYMARTDYDAAGIILIVLFYQFRNTRMEQCLTGLGWIALMSGKWYYIPGLIPAFLMIYYYDGSRGRCRKGYVFYLIYPLHMLVLAGIHRMLLL